MRPEKKKVELSEDEKLILSLLAAHNNSMEINILKSKTELSGKKWDTAMKGLAKQNLTCVIIDGDRKVVEVKN
ncbi:MAG TPA: hypothetical protein DDZ41_04500 [Flavobacterium sp.]|nr:hypothetical protein [Flavobacterium sp.]